MAFQKIFVNEKTSFLMQNRDYVNEIINFLKNNEIPSNFKLFSNKLGLI